MFPLLFAAALSGSPFTGCEPKLARGEAVIERHNLRIRKGTLQAVAVVKSGEEDIGPASRMMVLGSRCNVIFSQAFEFAEQVRFSEGHLGDQPFLFVTAFRPGGSGCGYDQTILAYGGDMFPEDGVEPLAPMPLGHDNMDGIFVGDLGRGVGPGLLTWSAQWDGGGHYSPHPYKIVSYLWRNGRFVGPNVRTTKRKYTPDPNAVAQRLGFTFHDMTQQQRFGGC